MELSVLEDMESSDILKESKRMADSIKNKYEIKIEKVSNDKGWDYTKVNIYLEGLFLHSYIYKYPSNEPPFFPFTINGQDYALYSEHYTATKVMKLPECIDVWAEEPNSFGFCPVEYYVPANPISEESMNIGFVAGCVWSDDIYWKIQLIDLTNIEQGIITRDDRMGYVQLPHYMHLSDAIIPWFCDLEDIGKHPLISVINEKWIRFYPGKADFYKDKFNLEDYWISDDLMRKMSEKARVDNISNSKVIENALRKYFGEDVKDTDPLERLVYWLNPANKKEYVNIYDNLTRAKTVAQIVFDKLMDKTDYFAQAVVYIVYALEHNKLMDMPLEKVHVLYEIAAHLYNSDVTIDKEFCKEAHRKIREAGLELSGNLELVSE